MNFNHKIVLITGAGSGIGKAIAIHFAKFSARLSLLDINEQNLNKVAEECEDLSKSKVFTVITDLRNRESIKNAVNSIKQEFGKIDVVVNCAGIAPKANIRSVNLLNVLDTVLDINVISVIALTHYATEALIESKGCVINIASMMATTVGKERIAYYVSKAAIVHFTKCAALELAEMGVRVNCISPGPVKTNILSEFYSSQEEKDTYWDSFIEDHPLKRLVTAEDIAEMAVFLASDKAKSITGCDYIIDSGMSLTKFSDEKQKQIGSNSNT